MSVALLDEDGRCRLTGLKPGECACEKHRNSETRQRLEGVTFDRYIDAIYAGNCALSEEHSITPGERIGHTEQGWACNRCVRDARGLA